MLGRKARHLCMDLFDGGGADGETLQVSTDFPDLLKA